MDKIFLIAGMGADTRLYNNIELPNNYEIIPVDWISPDKTDTLGTYAQKLINKYHITSNSIVIGNSMGGMMAVEIAKVIKLQKVILISSIKTRSEAPGYFNWFEKVPIYKIIPDKIYNSLRVAVRYIFCGLEEGDVWLLGDMLEQTSPEFLKWAMGAVVSWHNEVIPPNLYHITGNKDKVFNYKLINDARIIEGGTHVMVIDKAKEINKWLKQILKK
jgi:hypothetical protein